MTLYSGQLDQLAIAQQVLDEHVTSSVDGLCRWCGVPGPCFRRETAVVVFSRYLRLPRRIPGLSRPELIGARRIGPAADRPVTRSAESGSDASARPARDRPVGKVATTEGYDDDNALRR